MTDHSNSFLTELEEGFYKALLEQFEKGDPDRDQIIKAIEPAYTMARSETAAMILKTLRRDAPKMLHERRKEITGFEKRNFRRWRKAFDLFEMMIVMAGELGEHNDIALRPQAQKNLDYKFEALAQLQPRAVLVSREILCLLKGGFPDGALARWRSLHELTVTAIFIAKQDQTAELSSQLYLPLIACCQTV